MAKKIDEATIIKINEVYLECGVKSQTAKICGVSPSTVTKYLIPDYKNKRNLAAAAPVFEGTIKGSEDFIKFLKNCEGGMSKGFCEYCVLTEEEKEEMKKIQEGILV